MDESAGPALSARRLRLAWDHAPIGMVIVDLEGNWLAANDALCRLLGRDRDQLRGAVVAEVTHPDDLQQSLASMQQLFRGEHDRYTLEKRYLHADGHVVHAQLTASVVRDDGGEPDHLLGQIVDLTGQRDAEERLREKLAELERSNQTLETFAEVASHDLTSPLSTAQSLLEHVQVRHAGELGDEVADLLDRVQRQTARALETTRALLGLGRPRTAGRPAGQHALGELLGGVREALAEELDDVEISVQEDVTLTGDRAQLQVLFQNLLANASKYRAPDRPLTIDVHGQNVGSETIVHVDDTGIGLVPEERERIFDLRVRGKQVGDVPGLGLGLATCRSIVEHHGGSIEAHPRDEGGTRFTVRLPHRAVGEDRPG